MSRTVFLLFWLLVLVTDTSNGVSKIAAADEDDEVDVEDEDTDKDEVDNWDRLLLFDDEAADADATDGDTAKFFVDEGGDTGVVDNRTRLK